MRGSGYTYRNWLGSICGLYGHASRLCSPPAWSVSEQAFVRPVGFTASKVQAEPVTHDSPVCHGDAALHTEQNSLCARTLIAKDEQLRAAAKRRTVSPVCEWRQGVKLTGETANRVWSNYRQPSGETPWPANIFK